MLTFWMEPKVTTRLSAAAEQIRLSAARAMMSLLAAAVLTSLMAAQVSIQTLLKGLDWASQPQSQQTEQGQLITAWSMRPLLASKTSLALTMMTY